MVVKCNPFIFAKGMRFVSHWALILSMSCLGVTAQAQQSSSSAGAAVQAQASATANGTVPRLMNFSGTLKDVSNAPASGSVGLTLSLYEQQEGGSVLWSENQNVQVDATGHFKLVLGVAHSDGLPVELFTGSAARWLGVRAQLPGAVEQPRVLLVAVPYALKAVDADTLGGRPASEYLTAASLSAMTSQTFVQAGSPAASGQSSGSGNSSNTSSQPSVINQGPTDFSGSTTDQVVLVTQSGTGAGVNATAGGNAVVGTSSGSGDGVEGISQGTSGVGVLGNTTATTGSTIGVKGGSSSTSGTGIRAVETATTGSTTGISSYVASASGTAAVFNNAAGGKMISGQNNGVEKFSVDGSGNVTTSGHFTGSGSGLTGIGMSQLTGTLSSAQLSGTYSSALTFSNNSNSYYGSGAHLTGVPVSPGSPNYIQNTSSPQSASLSITGSATVAGTVQGNFVQANTVNSIGPLEIGGLSALSLGGQFIDHNLFIGYDAGHSNVTGSGQYNTFTGSYAGQYNTTGSQNTYIGYSSGYANSGGTDNTAIGFNASVGNGYAAGNTSVGANAGIATTIGSGNTFIGTNAGQNNTTGAGNTFIGSYAGQNNTTGYGNIYLGSLGNFTAQENNTLRLGGNQITTTYITGIYHSLPGPDGITVFVDSSGHLGGEGEYDGLMQQVQDMGDSSSKLMQLRPITFSLKPEVSDDTRMRFGFVAGEVDKVFPELVAHKADGTPSAVRSQYLTPMLLNEVQKQYHKVEAQAETIKAQQQRIDQLEQRLSKLESMLGSH